MDLRSWGPMTTLVVGVAFIVVVVGGVVVIVEPDTLSFQDYLDSLTKLAIALAGLGLGRGYLKGKQATAAASASLTEATRSATKAIQAAKATDPDATPGDAAFDPEVADAGDEVDSLTAGDEPPGVEAYPGNVPPDTGDQKAAVREGLAHE